MIFKWRKWNRNLHRDFGYVFFGMSIIYGLSGIALNHLDDWNPNYSIKTKEFRTSEKIKKESIDKKVILNILKSINEKETFKKYYFSNDTTLKVFIKGGNVIINTNSGYGKLEKIKKRQIFNQFNFLHYNSARKLWTWFSDIYAGALIFLAISGLFIKRGKKGITGRGAWLTSIGIIIPIILFLLYH